MIKRLQIENFKSIQSQFIELTNLNVLIGQNGSGKSNFISFFTFLERLIDKRLEEYIFDKGGINTFLYGGYELSQRIGVSAELSKITPLNYNYEFEIYSNGIDYQLGFEVLQELNKQGNPSTAHIANPHPNYNRHETKLYEQFAGEGSAKAQKEILNYIKSFRIYHFQDTSDNAKCKLPQDIDDVYQLKREAENIAAFLFFLRNQYTSNYNQILETIRIVYPQFHDFELQEMPNAKGKIILRWSEKSSENIYFPTQISDGTLRFICLATLLLQPQDIENSPQTIILDEPELGLHPFAIHVLAELIKKCALQKQVILATQSVTLINYFQPEDLLIVERNKEGATEFKRKDTESLKEWLEDYTLGQLWENNFLGGRP